MKKATAVILTGIFLLFLGSLYAGLRIFPDSERNLSLMGNIPAGEGSSPDEAAATQKRAEFRQIRLALSSFDLAVGLTSRDLEAISSSDRSLAFYFLMASIWLALGLRKPKRD
jgi:hypothetical protein|uniref:Uncharacterized protein n=1 Tax=Desulfobacca acetoxidans TaxID=60893 RepID=A0A7C3SKF0_9BACT